MNHEERRTKIIKFKNLMLTSSLRHYSDTFVFLKATVTAKNTPAQGAAAYNINKKVIFKNCAPFINCISRIINT